MNAVIVLRTQEKMKMYPENKMILFLASLTLMDLIAVVKAFL